MKIKNLFLLMMVISVCLFSPVQAQSIEKGGVDKSVVDKIVAIVNDDIITLVDLQKGTAPYVEKIKSSGYDRERQDRLIEKVNEDILNKLIDQSLTQQEAKRYGISIPESEIDQSIENIKTMRSLNQEELEAALKNEGATIQEFRETIKNQILQSKIIEFAVKSKVVVTESDIRAYYDAYAKKYAGKKKYHLRNILMQDETLVAQIKKRLENNESFISLAKEFSMASNASDGGDLGLFDISNFSKEIKTNIARLNKGEVTDVIPTAQGFQIFYVEDIVLEGNQSFEQASKEIKEILYQEQVEKKFKNWLERLKTDAHVKKMP